MLVRATAIALEYGYEWWLANGQSESLHALTEQALPLVTREQAGPTLPAQGPRR